jgi:MFS family permease
VSEHDDPEHDDPEQAAPGRADRGGWRTRLSGVHVDLTPLRTSRDFRILFAAGVVFYLGGMVTYVALPYQLYRLTGSNWAVGAMGIAELLPLLVFGLWGGALADHVDRRRMLVGTGVAQAALTSVLLVNAALAQPRVWLLYVVGVLLSAAQALQRPSREALIPRTVRHDQLAAAVALSSLGMEIGVLLGPTLGGVLLSTAGVAWAFAVDVVGLVIATALFSRLRPYPPIGETTPPSVAGILEGVRYAVSRRDLLGTYVVDMVAMFMAVPVVLFPALAADVFARPELLGLLYTAETVGSLVATATSGWTARVHHHGRAVVLAAAAWGGSVALAGLAGSIWLALGLFAVAGAADMVSGIFRGTVWHQTIPDDRRGRLAGIEMLSYSIGPLGGQARAGIVADLTSVRTSIVSGGLLCVVGVAATAVWLRDFWRYDARTDEHAVRERAVREARAGLA